MFTDWRIRVRSIILRRKVDRELDEELAFHLEQHVAASIGRGMARADAERLARIELGGAAQIREEHRDARGITIATDLVRDAAYAWRSFRRLPGFAVVALLVLALGIGATTVMFTILDAVLFRPLPYPAPDRLVAVHGFDAGSGLSWMSYPDFRDIEGESRSLSLAGWMYGGGTVSAPGDTAHVDARRISADLFGVLGIAPTTGRAFDTADDRPAAAPVAIISDDLAQRRYGGRAVAIGQLLVFEGMAYTVVGVAPAEFTLDGEADVLTPLGQNVEARMENRSARFLHVLGRLRPGASVEEGQRELSAIASRLATSYPLSNRGRDLRLRSLRDEIVGSVGSTLWLLLGAVGAVLGIACVNVASLLLARAVSRDGELATRVALGASRGRVVRQCLAEGALLGLAGGLLGALVAGLGVTPFVRAWPGSLPRAATIQLDAHVLALSLTVSIACGLAFGLVPALRVPASRLDRVLRAGGRAITGRSRILYRILVGAEIALAVTLLVSAATLTRTLLTLAARDPGVNARGVVTARVALAPDVLEDSDRIRAVWADVLDRAQQTAGVQSAALTDIVPMRAGDNALDYRTTVAPVPPSEATIALASTVTADYFRVMGIPLRAGRFFNEHDQLRGEPVVIVDDLLARHAFGDQDVVGQQLWVSAMGPAPLRIVGVVGHVRHWGLAADDHSRVRDQMYYPFAQVPPQLMRTFSSFMSIAVRTNTPTTGMEPLEANLRAAGGHTLYEVRTMKQLVAASLARQRFLVLLFGIFGGLATLMACVGVYGVLAYLTNQRATELALRMALGARATDVIRLVVEQGASAVAAGLLVGAAGAWACGRILEHLVDGAQPMEPVVLAIPLALLTGAAFLASALPARRATRIGLTEALRME